MNVRVTSTASKSARIRRRLSGQAFVTGTLARGATFPIAALAVLVTNRLILDRESIQSYAFLSLLTTVPALLPVSDLGLGAAVTNAAARANCAPNVFRTIAVRALRILVGVACLIALIAIALRYTGILTGLVPRGLLVTGADDAMLAALLVFAASLPFSLGMRVLIGLGLTTRLNLIQGLLPVITLTAVVTVLALGGSLSGLAFALLCGPVVTGLILSVMAYRSVAEASNSDSQRPQGSYSFELHNSGTLRATALPMIIISIAVPLAFQTDRWILSLRSTPESVAKYSAAVIVLAPALAMIQGGMAALWGQFARGSSREVQRSAFIASIRLAIALGLALFLAVLLLGPFVVSWISRGELEMSMLSMLPFGLFALVMAIHSPAASYLTKESGLRYQALGAVLMAIASIAMTWILAPVLGASGPVVASLLAMVPTMVIPCFLRSMRELEGAALGDEDVA